MPIVYRVAKANDIKIGMYTLCDISPADHRPGPFNDDEPELNSSYRNWCGHHFGFRDLMQLKAWIGEEYIKLIQANCVIYEIDSQVVWEGRYQVVFDLDNAVINRIMKPEEVFDEKDYYFVFDDDNELQ
jgi:hypothetical protein